jgi:hypothetical protein
MNCVKLPQVERGPQGVGLDEAKRIPRLRPVIDPDNIKARTVVSHSAPTGPTEQVE